MSETVQSTRRELGDAGRRLENERCNRMTTQARRVPATEQVPPMAANWDMSQFVGGHLRPAGRRGRCVPPTPKVSESMPDEVVRRAALRLSDGGKKRKRK